MDKKDGFWGKNGKEEKTPVPVSYEEKKDEEMKKSVPESYYSNITTPSDGEDRYYEIFEKTKHKTRGWSVAALIFAIVSVFCSYFGWVGLAFGIIAISLSVVSRVTLRYFDGMCIAGLIIGIFGIVFSTSMIVIDMLIASGTLDAYLNKLPFIK